MADHAHITRRAAVVGAIASSVALAVPVARAANGNPEHMPIADRAEFYAHKLAETLNEMNPGGEWQYAIGYEHGIAVVHRPNNVPMDLAPDMRRGVWTYTRMPIPGID